METPQNKITQLDYVLSGTIIKKYGPCGKKGCRCTGTKKNWHGPYYIWTRKESGKTITKSLSPTQAQFCRKAIANFRKLKAHIEKWRRESCDVLNEV
jgi:hypothetical protein